MSGRFLRVLVTSAGRRAGLLQCFRDGARALGAGIELHACDLEPRLSAACALADHAFGVPRCTEERYIEALFEYARAHRIDLLVPTIDTELPLLSRSADRFAAIGCRVHVGAPEMIAIVRDKHRTCATLEAAGVPVPRTLSLAEARALGADDPLWPLFAKPAGGSASRGLQVVRAPGEIAASYDEPMIFQELLDGPEYTVNVFVDRAGAFRTAIPHLRISTRAGEVEKGRTVRDPRFTAIAEALVAALPGARGVLCFQLIDDPRRGPRVFEINARFGGGYPLADAAGATFARWLLAEVLEIDSGASDEWRDGIEMLRFDAAVFRDASGAAL